MNVDVPRTDPNRGAETDQLADKSALHGLLTAIHDLGLSLVSVETITVQTDELPPE